MHLFFIFCFVFLFLPSPSLSHKNPSITSLPWLTCIISHLFNFSLPLFCVRELVYQSLNTSLLSIVKSVESLQRQKRNEGIERRLIASNDYVRKTFWGRKGDEAAAVWGRGWEREYGRGLRVEGRGGEREQRGRGERESEVPLSSNDYALTDDVILVDNFTEIGHRLSSASRFAHWVRSTVSRILKGIFQFIDDSTGCKKDYTVHVISVTDSTSTREDANYGTKMWVQYLISNMSFLWTENKLREYQCTW